MTSFNGFAKCSTSFRNARAANAVRLQLLTGARLGEVLGSRKEHYDLARGAWTKPAHQTKQKRAEHLPLSAQALALVASIIEASDPNSPFLFPGNKSGQPLRDIKKFWSSVLRQAGITNYRRHDNRHTYASHLVSSGLSLEIVGRLLGHTTAATTKRYAHLADDPLRAATERFGSKIAAYCVEKESGRGEQKAHWERNDAFLVARMEQIALTD
jgi:integrase